MMDKQTLMELAKLSGMRPWQQEKHYIQSLVLQEMSEEPAAFKGGTYLWFFHGLNRFSEDLDFTQDGEMAEGLPRRVSKALESYGVEHETKLITDDERTLSFRLSARGPLHTGPRDACYVYVEISRRERPLKEVLPLRLDLPQYNLPVRILRSMNLEEVGAEKVRALATRQKARDIFDLWYLIGHKKIAFSTKMVANKMKYYGTEFDKEMVMKRIDGSAGSFEKEMKPLVLGAAPLPPFSECRKAIDGWMK